MSKSPRRVVNHENLVNNQGAAFSQIKNLLNGVFEEEEIDDAFKYHRY
jgi:hypothetical protein